MAKVKKKLPWWVKLMRYFGRSVVILWAVAVLLFVGLTVIGEVMEGHTAGIPVLIVAFVLLVSGAVIPWVWEGVGAFLLLGEALFLLVFFMIVSWDEGLFSGPIIASLPPFVGGGLSLACWLIARKGREVAST